MKLACGTECYQADSGALVARGRSYTAEEVSAAIDGPVSERVRDDVGKEVVAGLLLGLAETGFELDGVSRILSHERVPEDWRVGEAFAECHLRDHRSCSFPWPSGRDQKNPNSSPAGADLVGFEATDREENCHRFAFGEVKTSKERRWPPQVMSGRHDMARQLESLRDDLSARDHLVMYLCHRAVDASWAGQYKQAAARYLAEPTDVALFGVLVRDVEPKAADLRSRASVLATNCPVLMRIELIAHYFPEGTVEGLGKRVNLQWEELGGRN